MRNWNTDAIKIKSVHWLLVSFFCYVIVFFIIGQLGFQLFHMYEPKISDHS